MFIIRPLILIAEALIITVVLKAHSDHATAAPQSSHYPRLRSATAPLSPRYRPAVARHHPIGMMTDERNINKTARILLVVYVLIQIIFHIQITISPCLVQNPQKAIKAPKTVSRFLNPHSPPTTYPQVTLILVCFHIL